MKRVIKFRGKRVDNGKWVYGYYGITQINHGIWSRIDGNEFPQWYQVLPETVGQFTGLADKNGKEYYENDIVQPTYGKAGVVKFGEGEYNPDWWCVDWFGWFLEGVDVIFSKYEATLMEIIGNTTDNPELIGL